MQFIFTKQDHKKHKCLHQAAKILRKQQTPHEKELWQRIKGKQLLNIQFHRQHILLNCYIVDFYAPAVNLVIELDGSQHNLEENKENDLIRDQKLAVVGITVKRFANAVVRNNIGYIMQELYNFIRQKLNRH